MSVVDLVKHRRDPDIIVTIEVWRDADGMVKWDGGVTARTDLRVPWAMATAVRALDEYANGLRHRHRMPSPVRRRRHRVKRNR